MRFVIFFAFYKKIKLYRVHMRYQTRESIIMSDKNTKNARKDFVFFFVVTNDEPLFNSFLVWKVIGNSVLISED